MTIIEAIMSKITAYSFYEGEVECENCNGAGHVFSDIGDWPCAICNGTGVLK